MSLSNLLQVNDFNLFSNSLTVNNLNANTINSQNEITGSVSALKVTTNNLITNGPNLGLSRKFIIPTATAAVTVAVQYMINGIISGLDLSEDCIVTTPTAAQIVAAMAAITNPQPVVGVPAVQGQTASFYITNDNPLVDDNDIILNPGVGVTINPAIIAPANGFVVPAQNNALILVYIDNSAAGLEAVQLFTIINGPVQA
jgi:hypothetical protein